MLLTGAVFPHSLPLALVDPQERLLQYLCAITCWLGEPSVERLLYCDGGGFCIPAETFGTERFASVAFDLRATSQNYGKGRAEATIVANALAAGLVRGEGFYKVTGRLYVENFVELDAALDKTKPFSASRGKWKAKSRAPGRRVEIVETDVLWTHISFFQQHLAPLTEQINDHQTSSYIEAVYARATKHMDAAEFPVRPRIVGVAATNNRPYSRDYDPGLRNACRELLQSIDLSQPT